MNRMSKPLESDPSVRGLGLAALVAGIALVAWAALVGMRARSEPSHCPTGTSGEAGRCCAAGQRASGGRCVGTPDHCPAGTSFVPAPAAGCVVVPEKVLISGGSVLLGPTDWDGPNVRPTRIVSVRSFYLDHTEVTEHRYGECTRAGMCPTREHALEPGLPVSSVDASAAETFCAFAGGRLPTTAEWTFAAAGAEGRRYPWGPHGLVCRRAAYGRVNGPCTKGARTADLAGIRGEGKTPEGVLDLAGNVAEWTRDEDGRASLRGGSFASAAAAELKSWAEQPPRVSVESGFRCAYPPP
jgi:formylglycine-generating enzyme required for sulfatase activity